MQNMFTFEQGLTINHNHGYVKFSPGARWVPYEKSAKKGGKASGVIVGIVTGGNSISRLFQSTKVNPYKVNSIMRWDYCPISAFQLRDGVATADFYTCG